MASRSIHPFPARMAPEIALDAIPERTERSLTVLDPMCGSGTVLATALQRGHDAVGTDVDPLAVMMSRLAVTDVDCSVLQRHAEGVLATARRCEGEPPWGADAETNAFADFWFGPDQRRQLIALSSAIDAVGDDDQRLALRLALSRIIVTKSPRASLAADTSHSRPHRVKSDSDYDVLDGFDRSARQLGRFLAARTLRGRGSVAMDDARELATVQDEEADLAVTSPPYLNALDYMRGHKFALIWFGYTIPDLRQRRGESIGSERGLSEPSSPLVGEILELIERDAANPEGLRRFMVQRYAHDCVGFASQLNRALKPHGTAVLVVGNSTLRGNYIRNSLITQRSMEGAGFKLVSLREREIPPNRRYMAINSKTQSASSITNRMRTEVVLTMEKSNA